MWMKLRAQANLEQSICYLSNFLGGSSISVPFRDSEVLILILVGVRRTDGRTDGRPSSL